MIKCSWLPPHPFLVLPDHPGPAFLTLQAAHFLTRLGPRSVPAPEMLTSVGESGRAGAGRGRDTWPGGGVTSVSPGPETELQPRDQSAATRFIVVFWKSVPVSRFPGQSREDVTQSLQVLVVPVITQILAVNTFKLQIYCSDFLKNQRPLMCKPQ